MLTPFFIACVQNFPKINIKFRNNNYSEYSYKLDIGGFLGIDNVSRLPENKVKVESMLVL